MKTLRSIIHFLISCLPKAAAGSLAALSLLLPAGCERRPLHDPGEFANIRIRLKTNAIFNVTTGVYNEKIPVPDINPEAMEVRFYEKDGDGLVAQTWISEKSVDDEGNTVISGTIQINPGQYKMIIYNFDTKSTTITNAEKWSKAYAHTSPVSDYISSKYYASRAELEAQASKSGSASAAVSEMEIIAYEPDHLIVATDPNQIIPYHEGTYTIYADAHSIIDTYYLQIYVEGAEWLSNASAYLSGMASGNMLAENRRITEPTNTVYFILNPTDDNGDKVIANVFNTFGHIPEKANRLDITFNLKTKDGRSLQHALDITDVFQTPEAIEKHWLIIRDTIKVDPPPDFNPDAGGGGMDPAVDDWVNENHDIHL